MGGKHLVYQLGHAAQGSGAVGKKVDERKPNYGLEVIGKSDSYASLDFGVGFRPSPRTKVLFVASAGQREYYTSYSENRYNGRGYHMVDRTGFVAGGGVSFHFPIHARWGMELGANSLHGAVVTIQYLF